MDYSEVLKKSTLFYGMDDEMLTRALKFFDAMPASFKKDDFLFRDGEKMQRFGLVLKGTVQVFSDDVNGDRAIMASVSEGMTFGESLCYLETKYPGIYIFADSDCEILRLSCDKLRNDMADEREYREFSKRFIRLLAGRALSMNDRIQVLSKHTLRQKINTFFAQCIRHTDKRNFTVSFDREDMASYLGADRSALSRELSAMKKDGIIRYNHSDFELLQ